MPVKFFKSGFSSALVILIALVAAFMIKAQTNVVDLSFNAVPDKAATAFSSNIPANFIVQPDGKIIVTGTFFSGFQVVNGVLRNQIARFNTDGSLDTTFNCASCDFSVISAALQPDGKIIVAGGANTSVNSFTLSGQARIYRLNADGSRDESFVSPFPVVTSESDTAEVREIQPDGKVLVVLIRSFTNARSYELYRLNPNGTFDTTFTSFTITSQSGGTFSSSPGKISVAPDGKIFVVVNSSANCPGCGGGSTSIKRYNSNGTLDSTFESPSFTNTSGDNTGTVIGDFDIQSDGSLVIVGRFTAINGVSRSNVAKLMPFGNVDTSFNTPSIGSAGRVEILANGKLLIGTAARIYRVNADGSLDNSFNTPTNITSINKWVLDSAGRIVLFGTFTENNASVNKFARLNQDGSLESSFTASFGVGSSITAVAAQSDGKVVFTGDFIRVNGVPRVSLARVNPDGSTDSTFNSTASFTGTVSKLLIQSDDKILVAGDNLTYNGGVRRGFFRLNADGSLDENFNPNAAIISFVAIALQPDGKIIIGGNFNAINGQARNVVRLNADGSLDASFNPTFGSATINSILVQSDGKILIGGAFNGANGFSRVNLVRLNADGTLDNTFNAGNVSAVKQIEVSADGRYLVLLTSNTIIKLNNSGTTDSTFSSPTFNEAVYQFLAQADGNILVVGNFTQVYSVRRLRIARLTASGGLDTGSFNIGANGLIRTIARQADGRILVGGDFTSIEGVIRLGIARLNIAAYSQRTRFDFDGDGRADVAVFRPSNGNWYILPSGTNAFYGFPFGQAGDQIAPADYDGDGKTDVAVFRETVPGAGDKAYFYIINSTDNSFRAAQFGTQGDVPMAGDWDGDGKADLAVYRAATTTGGQSNFYYRPSSQPAVDYVTIAFGMVGDKPLYGDFDGDGRLDPAVFISTSPVALWRILQSSVNQVTAITFGSPTDIPVPADYNGDGRTDIAVFRPSNGTWYTSQNPSNNYGAIQFGANGDVPLPADYDGDGRADTAVFRPSNGAWYLNRTTNGFTGVQFGVLGDKPTPNAFIR